MKSRSLRRQSSGYLKVVVRLVREYIFNVNSSAGIFVPGYNGCRQQRDRPKPTEVNHVALKGLSELLAVELDNVFGEAFGAGTDSDRSGADDILRRTGSDGSTSS